MSKVKKRSITALLMDTNPYFFYVSGKPECCIFAVITGKDCPSFSCWPFVYVTRSWFTDCCTFASDYWYRLSYSFFFGKACPSFSCWPVVYVTRSWFTDRPYMKGKYFSNILTKKKKLLLLILQYFSHRHGFELWSSQIEEIWYETMNTGQKVWLKSNNCGAFFFFFKKQPCYKFFIYFYTR